MAIATRTDSSLAATITQSNFVTALKTAFTNAGFTNLVDEFTSGTDKILVYDFVSDNTKTVGTLYLRVRITTALLIAQQLYTTWTVGTHTGTNASTEVTYITLATTSPVNFIALNGSSEYRFVVITQGSLFALLGVLAPASRPAWWDLNSWSWGFITTGSTLATWRASGLCPYSPPDFDTFLNNARMATQNLQTNRRELLKGIILLNQSNTGTGGRTSDDLAFGYFSGTGRFDVNTPFGTTQSYLVITNTSGGFAVRTA